MHIFAVTKPMTGIKYFTVAGEDIPVPMNLLPHDPQGIREKRLDSKRIYISTAMELNFIKEALTPECVIELKTPLILSHSQAPKPIGRDWSNPRSLDAVLEPLAGKERLRLCVLNGMGIGFGDAVIGLTALRRYREELQKRFPSVSIDVYSMFMGRVGGLHRAEPSVAQAFVMPISLFDFFSYDAYVWFDGLNSRPEFNNQPMIDYYFDCFLMDKHALSPEQKRPVIGFDALRSERVESFMQELREKAGKLLWFHTKASTPIREIPDEKAREYALTLAEQSGFHLVTSGLSGISHPNHTDVTKQLKSFGDFVTALSCCDRVITVDTSTYHVTEALGIPATVLFTSINPDFRIRYYPHTRGVTVSPEGNPLAGQHMTTNQKLIDYSRTIWGDLDILSCIPR